MHWVTVAVRFQLYTAVLWGGIRAYRFKGPIQRDQGRGDDQKENAEREPHSSEASSHQILRLREDKAARNRASVLLDESSGQGGGSLDGDLLSEDGADRQLEAVPGSRHPEPGSLSHKLGEHAIGLETRVDRRRIGVEVEQSANSRSNGQ